MGGKNHTFPLPFGTPEIQDQTNLKPRDTEIVEHLAAFVIGDSLDHLGVDDEIP